MKTIEEMVKEIKKEAECSIYGMENHKRICLKDDVSFDGVIEAMHNAQNKDMLIKAYYEYINLCICAGYGDGYIIAGIMQNEEQNKKFNVDIETVIKSLIEIKKYPIKSSEKATEKKQPKQETAVKDVNPKTEEVKNKNNVNEKTFKRIHDKLDYFMKLKNKAFSEESSPEIIEKIYKVSQEIKDLISSVDRSICTECEIKELDEGAAVLDDLLKAMDELKNVVNNQKAQAAVAHTANGFNIANFIKDESPVVNQQPQQEQVKPKSAFPHEICGLTDEQIVEEINKHYKLITPADAYPLYDLFNNRLLSKKMKELDAKQRPNNPYLTQVDINEYIDVPELLEQYTLCFTMPCNDKKQLIVVLFNPTPVEGKNGIMQYPLHIFKAAKTKNNK